jgi:selenocysteine-specific elongation factor
LLETDLALLDLPEPLCLQVGDRFILRETGRRTVMGGGRVLDPDPPPSARRARAGRAKLQAVLDGEPDEIAELLVEVRSSASLADLAADTGGGNPQNAVVIDDVAYSASLITALSAKLTAEVAEFHRSNPLRPGLATASIAPRWGLSTAVIEEIANRHPGLTVEHGIIASKSHRVSHDPSQEQAWEQARSLLSNGLSVPRVAELGLAPDLFHALVRDGLLVRIAQDLAYLPDQVKGLLEVVRSIPAPFTVGDFKDAAGISRKYAVPILEWTDANNVTVRRGDLRTLK